jgi:tagatose 6-phosphate kinase
MILCIALNPALDVTYTVAGVRWHAGNRVTSVAQRAGGKATNVARVLHALRHRAVVTGFRAGESGEVVARDLADAGVAEAFLPVPGETRRTLAVVDTAAGDATGFWEPGPTVPAERWAAFLHHYRGLLAGAAVVVLSGSLPPGVPGDAYAILVAAARKAGVPAIVDADGPALVAAAGAGPDIVKPNADELRAATGRDDPAAGAADLLSRGAGAVVVSRGAEGLLAATPGQRWTVRPPARLAGNPTGAGDACVAALAAGLATAADWPARLAMAVALSASAVLRPLAGDVDLDAYRRLRNSVVVQEV